MSDSALSFPPYATIALVGLGAVALQVFLPLIGDAVLTLVVATTVGRLCYVWGRESR